MRIDVVTLFPQMFALFTDFGVTGRAADKGILDLTTWNPRDYTTDRHNTVDDRPYGGGPGMVMMFEPLQAAIHAAKAQSSAKTRVIYLSPQGRKLDQGGLDELAKLNDLILVCGRYEGIDERLIAQEVDEEWSIGDYVLSGGELAAMVVIDGITRLLPDVLGHSESAKQDSFVDGLLDHPQYTRPVALEKGQNVPDVLLSGDHQAIENWRNKQALGRTWLRRPDLLKKRELDSQQQKLLSEFIKEYETD